MSQSNMGQATKGKGEKMIRAIIGGVLFIVGILIAGADIKTIYCHIQFIVNFSGAAIAYLGTLILQKEREDDRFNRTDKSG